MANKSKDGIQAHITMRLKKVESEIKKIKDFVMNLKLKENTISDIIVDKKGRTIKYVNERPMKESR